jgi:tRNA uracil 4-sulfurtransferase
MTSILVHYQELALKGRNRPWFVERLVRNLREACAGLGIAEVRPLMGRLEIALKTGARRDAILARVAHQPGIANFALAERVAPDLDAIAASALRLADGRQPTSFRVAATRADKQFPASSPDVERYVGQRLIEASGWKVSLKHPELVVRVEIVPGLAFCSIDREPGVGGLPVGVSGRGMALLSGGIDSPVAAWRMMRRGCRVDFVHFHSYPVTSMASMEKARALATRLAAFQLRSRLWMVPFADVQRAIVVSAPAALRVVLYRRFMVRIADRIAWRTGGQVLVTGEVLGQVASQTIENLTVVEGAATMPMLRPLVGMDKEDITTEAKRIATYEISIRPDEDCCQVFTPRHPATRAGREEVDSAEAALDVPALVKGAVMQATREDLLPEWLDAG